MDSKCMRFPAVVDNYKDKWGSCHVFYVFFSCHYLHNMQKNKNNNNVRREDAPAKIEVKECAGKK